MKRVISNKAMAARWSLTALLLPAVCLSANTTAEASATAQSAPWYRVELIVFSRDSSTQEQWPQKLNLNYSPNSVQLKPAQTRNTENTPHNGAPISVPTSSPTSAFTLLHKDQLELKAHARSVNRKRDHRVLFHEAWDQPVLSKSSAPSITLISGDRFGQHNTLEGEIKLSVARYLHLTTNLWLTDFEANYGQLQNRLWPNLPSQPFSAAAPTASESEAPIDEFGVSSIFKLETDSENTGLNIGVGSELGSLSDDYLPREIIHMQQHRRMRSKEMHYIDHPRMGIIVKIMPLKG